MSFCFEKRANFLGRKLFCDINPTCYKISVKKETFLRNVKDFLSREKIAKEKEVMWTTVITYISGYLLLGSIISFFPETGEERSKSNYFFVWLLWPFVIIWLLLLILYTGFVRMIMIMINKIKTLNI